MPNNAEHYSQSFIENGTNSQTALSPHKFTIPTPIDFLKGLHTDVRQIAKGGSLFILIFKKEGDFEII